jgi:hypothetical protein
VLSWRQRGQQCLGLVQIGHVETLRETAVDRREQATGFIAPALILPEPCKAACSPQFPEFGALPPSHGQSLLEAGSERKTQFAEMIVS